MNPSPLLFSMTFVASISVLTAGVAWSAYEAQAKQAELSSSKARAVKARTPKPKRVFAKPASSSLETVKVNLTSTQQLSTLQPPLSPAVSSSAMPQYVPVAASEIANNPYFANQPAAILPLAARPAAINPTAKPAVAVAPAVIAPAITPVIAPVVSIPVPAVAATVPVKAAPPVAAAIPAAAAAPVVAALPSLEPPIYGAAAPVAANRAPVAAYQPWNSASAGNKVASTNPYLNPYLSYRTYQPQPLAAPAPVQPLTQPFNPFGSGNFKFSMPSLPSLPSFPSLPQAGNPESAAYQPAQFNTQQAAASTGVVSSIFSNLKMMIPLTGDANILPTIKKVYPTGEKPLVVLNFKCPTEVVGITPPPMKLLHEAVNFGFDGLNKTNLLSFNLQQVCS